ncbi:hypothetical protein WJX74_009659 [Apatococcus lobatus]|uniref:Uncharacterized protein n=1 Tax=Apatococcus lobatus TaxID=904363 RepID=A0AAW1RNP3_9CHLO
MARELWKQAKLDLAAKENELLEKTWDLENHKKQLARLQEQIKEKSAGRLSFMLCNVEREFSELTPSTWNTVLFAEVETCNNRVLRAEHGSNTSQQSLLDMHKLMAATAKDAQHLADHLSAVEAQVASVEDAQHHTRQRFAYHLNEQNKIMQSFQSHVNDGLNDDQCLGTTKHLGDNSSLPKSPKPSA